MVYRPPCLRFFLGFLLALTGPPALAQERLTARPLLSVTALQPGGQGTLAVVFDVAAGFHSQSHEPLDKNLIPFVITPEEVPGMHFGEPVYPPAVTHEYKSLGKVSVYEAKSTVFIPILTDAAAKPGPVQIKATLSYQLCDDKVCFRPEKQTLTLDTRIAAPGETVQPADQETFKSYTSGPPVTRPAPVTQPSASSAALREPSTGNGMEPPRSATGAFALALLVGLVFNIMPCVLPVLPLKIMGFHQAAAHARGRTMLFGGFFSLGVIAVFLALGLVVVVLKKLQWGQQFSNPWFAWGMVLLLIAMAAGMFDAFALNLPSAVYSITPRHDTLAGNFTWGILTAVLSTPCTVWLFPPLLLWASNEPPAIGLAAMGTVGVGMAMPYFVLSAFPEAARRFPRTGPWAALVKQMMGFLILGFAAFFAAGRLMAAPAHWWATVPVALLASLWLLVRVIRLTHGAWPVAIASLLAVLITGVTFGMAARANSPSVAWQPYSDESFAAARASGSIVLIDFTANWCLNCQYVDTTVFHDRRVLSVLKDRKVTTFKADLTFDDAPGQSLLAQLNPAGGIPLTAIYFPDAPKPIQLPGVYAAASLVGAIDR
jgi:thiol:disulfide interchange protein